MQKKMARVLRSMPRIPGMTDDERILWARFLAATPDERWRLHQASLRCLGSFMHSANRKSRS